MQEVKFHSNTQVRMIPRKSSTVQQIATPSVVDVMRAYKEESWFNEIYKDAEAQRLKKHQEHYDEYLNEKRRRSRYDNPMSIIGHSSQLITWRKDEPKERSQPHLSTDPAFRKVKKNNTGFLIWRIENLNVIPVARDQYGTFYDKDSYIIYAATEYGQTAGTQTVIRELKGRPEFHIHFWLGLNTSADNAGVAAYKTVELDAHLGCDATQHREVQSSESPRFKSYFMEGIRILTGGTENSSRHVTDDFEPLLYRIKGRRAPVITQMNNISWEHFNSGDVFLLHTKTILFIWVGRAASSIEKLHATKVAMQLRTEENTPSVVFVDDGYERTLLEEDKEAFERYLPLSSRFVRSPDEENEEETEKKRRTNIKLYQCADNNGKYRVTEIKTGPLKQEDLISDDVFMLDHNIYGIWVWVGKHANDKERTEAIRNARGFVKKKKYPSSTAITRVIDGAEPLEFKMLFQVWREKDEMYKLAALRNKITVSKVTKFDALTMQDRPALAAKSQLIDDGSGTMRVWRMKKFDTVEVPKDRSCVFFSSDCYVVLYCYNSVGGAKYTVYCWLGVNSNPDEQNVALLKAIEIDNSVCESKAMQVRVVQGNEPVHFLQLFKGKMRIFNGKGTDFDITGKNMKHPTHCLLQIQGSSSYNTKGIQVVPKATSLNSNYCFVLRKGSTNYVWCGSASTGDNREMAKGFVGPDFALILEGNEIGEFWSALGGQNEYSNTKTVTESGEKMPARLFHGNIGCGSFRGEEILNFVQKDLAPEEVQILDAHNTIYVWQGKLCSKGDIKLSLQSAVEYLRADPSGRNLRTPIVQLKQGSEPPTFTGFFPTWDDTLWKDYRSYEELRTEIERSGANSLPRLNAVPSREDNNFDNFNKYPVHILRGPHEELPQSVDPLKKELHLTYDDFVALFCLAYKDFEMLPQWKQKEMKKKAGLF